MWIHFKNLFQDNASFSKQSQLARKKNDQIKYHVKNRFMALEFGRDAGKDNLVFIKMTIYIYTVYIIEWGRKFLDEGYPGIPGYN